MILFKELLKEKNNRYLRAIMAADKVEQQLSTCSKGFTDPANRQNYIKLAKEFKQYIGLVNLYNDSAVDCRDVFVNKMVNKLNLEVAQQRTVSETKEVEVQKETSQIIAIQANEFDRDKSWKKKNTQQQEYDGLWESANKLSKNLKSLLLTKSIEDNIHAHQVSGELRNTLLEIMFHPNHISDKNVRKKIKEIESIINTVPSLIRLFLDYAKGNFPNGLECCKALFPHLSESDKFLISYNLLQHLIYEVNLSSNIQEKIIEICEYLFEESKKVNSYGYKSAMFLLSNTAKLIQEINIAVFALMHVFYNDNLSVFQMLLKHGCDPNSYGFMLGNLAVPVLRAIIGSQTDLQQDARLAEKQNRSILYLKLLLELGAQMDGMPREVSAIATAEANKIIIKPLFLQSAMHVNIKNCPSDLLLACKCDIIHLVPTLLKYSGLHSMALSLAYLMDLQGCFGRTFMSSDPNTGVMCFANPLLANNWADRQKEHMVKTQMVNDVLQPSDLVQINIFMSEDSKYRYMYPVLEQILQQFKLLCKQQPNEVENLLEKILNDINNQAERNKQLVEIILCRAWQLLLVERGKKLTLRDAQTFMRTACFIAKSHAAQGNYAIAVIHCEIAAHCVLQISSYREILKNLPIYKFACKQLENYKQKNKNMLTQSSTLQYQQQLSNNNNNNNNNTPPLLTKKKK